MNAKATGFLALVTLLLLAGAATGISSNEASTVRSVPSVDPGHGFVDPDPIISNNTSTASRPPAVIVDVQPHGAGYIENQREIVRYHPGPPYVWRDEPLSFDVHLVTGQRDATLDLCGSIQGPQGERVRDIQCRPLPSQMARTSSVNTSIDGWPENASGPHRIVFSVRDDRGAVVSRHIHRVNVIEKEGDISGEGLTNEREVALGTDFTVADTSGNGLTDREEVEVYGTDPLEVDTTGDGIGDGTIVRLGLDPTQPYTVHLHVAAGLMLFTIIVGAIVVTTLQLLGIPLRAVGGLGRPTDVHRETSGDETRSGDSSPAEQGAGDVTVPDDRLLTDDEFVCSLIERRGGRMKQSQIVDSTGWSKAKVSRVLTRLDEDGAIEKLRVGRENLVELSDERSVLRRHRSQSGGSRPDRTP